MLLLTCLACLTFMTVHKAFAQESPVAGNSLAYHATRGAPLTLIDNSSPKFVTELETNFPSVLSMRNIDKALPYMVILRNDTAKTVRAYEIRWNDANPESDEAGELDILKATAITSPLELRWPAGNKSQDKSIRPGEERLVTPWSNIRRDELSDFDPSIARSQRTPTSPQGWKAHVDCVVYGDGSYFGPNRSRLLLAYFISRDAVHDEALAVLQALQRRPGDPELKAQLLQRVDIGASKSFSSNRAMALYKRARGVAAQEFSQILSGGRYRLVMATTRELVSTMPPREEFTPMDTPYRQAQFTVGNTTVQVRE